MKAEKMMRTYRTHVSGKTFFVEHPESLQKEAAIELNNYVNSLPTQPEGTKNGNN